MVEMEAAVFGAAGAAGVTLAAGCKEEEAGKGRLGAAVMVVVGGRVRRSDQ